MLDRLGGLLRAGNLHTSRVVETALGKVFDTPGHLLVKLPVAGKRLGGVEIRREERILPVERPQADSADHDDSGNRYDYFFHDTTDLYG